jgi:hypothetical protein
MNIYGTQLLVNISVTVVIKFLVLGVFTCHVIFIQSRTASSGNKSENQASNYICVFHVQRYRSPLTMSMAKL